jgi:hypothetical protein
MSHFLNDPPSRTSFLLTLPRYGWACTRGVVAVEVDTLKQSCCPGFCGLAVSIFSSSCSSLLLFVHLPFKPLLGVSAILLRLPGCCSCAASTPGCQYRALHLTRPALAFIQPSLSQDSFVQRLDALLLMPTLPRRI